VRGAPSELFGVDQRVEQIDRQDDADGEANEGFDHGEGSYSRSQATA
jgi:hypothetical protein